MATIVTAMVVVQANRVVASMGASPAAAYSAKNGGNTAVMIVEWNAESAQSYMAQARTSRRCSPRRDSSDIRPRLVRIARDPFAQQRIDDHVASAFLQQQV